MPPCLDVYVWVPERNPETLGRFVDDYVDGDGCGDGQRHGRTRYLRARAPHHQAIITSTRDGATVLGLSVDAPDDLPAVLSLAEDLMGRLLRQFSAPAGRAGVELPPAEDRSEWHDDALVLLRIGEPPPPEAGFQRPS
ncbi:hypothetical protein [Nonomuraea rhodomycinica]|uniref:Uncharacterized protein n=1 Tax=Nonomuraea rhodomycinica TaxID=1712872 RepID=A0A7Y6IYN8_9ACTN|nr:hypothetical protein [Nonomuraea rhodomycinica]NUW46283.1 hypothetical protein [Nonomuraea rhodomycinica]